MARLVLEDDEAVGDPERALTPAYCAPEQLDGEAASTLSDVWSLGTLLCWLLDKDSGSTAAPGRHRLPADLPRCADLDAIVARARAHQPEGRYEGVAQLLEDVRRYRHNHAVVARRPTRRYLSARFIQRHRLSVAAGMAAFMAIGVALAGALWQSHVASLERDRAELEAAKSREVSDFLVGLFEQADPGTAQGDEITARQLLATGIERAELLDGQPMVQSEMYRVLARVEMNLGDYNSAHKLARSALSVHDADQGNLSSGLTGVLVQIGDINLQQGNPGEAIDYYRRALTILEGVESPLTVEALNGLGGALVNSGDRLDEGIATLERAFEIVQRIEPETPLAAAVANNLGAAAYYDGRYDDAIAHFERANGWLIKRFGSDHPRVLFSQTNLVWLLTEQARFAEAEALLVDLLEAQENVLGEHHPHRAANLHTMGSLFWRQGNTDMAIEWWERALDARIAAFGAHHQTVAGTQNVLALALVDRGELQRAEALYEIALATLRDPDMAATVRLPATLSNLADLRIAQDRHDEAMRLHQEVLELRHQLLGADHPHIGITQRKIANLHLIADNPEQAREWARSSLETLDRALDDRSHPESVKTETLINRIDTLANASD